jgi:hypothetical protein
MARNNTQAPAEVEKQEVQAPAEVENNTQAPAEVEDVETPTEAEDEVEEKEEETTEGNSGKKYKALVSFSGLITMSKNEVRELKDKEIIEDLLKAKYIKEVK